MSGSPVVRRATDDRSVLLRRRCDGSQLLKKWRWTLRPRHLFNNSLVWTTEWRTRYGEQVADVAVCIRYSLMMRSASAASSSLCVV